MKAESDSSNRIRKLMQAESNFTNQSEAKSDFTNQMKVEQKPNPISPIRCKPSPNSSDQMKAESDSSNQLEAESDSGNQRQKQTEAESDFERSILHLDKVSQPNLRSVNKLSPPHSPPTELKPLSNHLKGSLTNKVVVETTEFDHPRCRQEKSDETTIPYQIANGSVRYRISMMRWCRLGFRIAGESEDQHKTTFTCPFGTFADTQMLFGLCNAPSTFQRCMISILSDLLEDCIEVLMDDFTVYAESFETCLENLSCVLTRCIETNLVLNFEKCHFIVTKEIVLGHLVSSRGIKVDKAKDNIITSLSNPASMREVRLFLGHVCFYGRFIKNFSKIALPLSKLFQKDVDFVFDQPCMEAFQEMKKRFTSTPILQALN
ncbi:Retrovirus-related Pol polyprotein, partial [Mucuna pruriens]